MAAISRDNKVLDVLQRSGNATYGLAEVAAGGMLLPVSSGLTAVVVFDGMRRVWRAMPSKLKAIAPRPLLKLVPSPRREKPGNKRDILNAADVGLGFGVVLAGALLVMGGVVVTFISAFLAVTPPVLPFVMGLTLMLGGGMSGAKRIFATAHDHAARPRSQKPAFLHSRSTLMDKKAAPEFNAKAEEPKEKPPAPKPPQPVIKPPSP